ncbi:hypothetical protein ACFC08_40310 [Streptomyces sp. NPDC056112]|uniref:hypothetical protein n=1 Tax=unclassified Streptomyces TaxID=2593676 RepID=UPI001CD290E2|nr:hypothetical protein [Streptomyces sp. CoT10]
MLLVAGGWLINYRLTYHTFAWWEAPARMSFCGRDYEPDGHEKALPKGDGTITPVFVVEPAGWQVYKQTWGNNGPECPVILLLQRNNHDVVVYSLLGGP